MPKHNVPDIRKTADVYYEDGMALIVDNTFGMGGYLAQSITPGAENVGLSATKWIPDHVIIMGG